MCHTVQFQKKADIKKCGVAEKLLIPDCVYGVVRGVEKERGCDGVDGTAVHVPARVREVAGDDLEAELWVATQ